MPFNSRLLRLPGRGILMDAVSIITILPLGKIGIVGGEVPVIKVIVRICHGSDLPFFGTPSLSLASIISANCEQYLTHFFIFGKNR